MGSEMCIRDRITGPFLVEVVYDIMPLSGWKVALEHFLLYIYKIDSGCGWQIATATSLGSNDTFLHRAVRAVGVGTSPPPPPQPSPPGVTPPGDKNQRKLSWNGKFDSAARPCAAHNLGQEHNKLNKDGACPFNHVCDQWVTGKGPGGRCESSSHARHACDNPSKSQSRVN